MNESMGSIPVIVVVMIFIIAVSGYIAFTVNYSKAFKAKSEIINIIQQNDNDVEEVIDTIGERLKTVQYSADPVYLNKNCPSPEWTMAGSQGWCYKIITTSSGSKNSDTKICNKNEKKYVKIKTIISIDVPVLKQIFSNISLFVVEGSTKSTTC